MRRVFRRAGSRAISCVGAINNERAAQTSSVKWCIETLLRQLRFLIGNDERRSPLVILLALVKPSRIAPLRAMSADTRHPCRSPAQSRRFYFREMRRARWASCERSSRWWIPVSSYTYGLRLIFLPLVAAEFFDLTAFHHLRRNYSNHQPGWREAAEPFGRIRWHSSSKQRY